MEKGGVVINYHNITYPDMNNGSGLRVVLWVSGCSHGCKKCQNSQTWDVDSGVPFDNNAKKELFRELSKDYISGITFSGGDPLHNKNLHDILSLITKIRQLYPEKTIWLYTGYEWEQIMKYEYGSTYIDNFNVDALRQCIVTQCDVLVEGKYIDELKDLSLQWCGSSNQRVIDVQQSLKKDEIVLWTSN